jgi:hypothetical protein
MKLINIQITVSQKTLSVRKILKDVLDELKISEEEFFKGRLTRKHLSYLFGDLLESCGSSKTFGSARMSSMRLVLYDIKRKHCGYRPTTNPPERTIYFEQE